MFQLSRIRVAYVLLIIAQITLISLYYLTGLPREVALAAGLATSVGGPSLSFRISLHVFRHRRRSAAWNIATAALTYAVTCTSFAVMYVIISGADAHAFSVAQGMSSRLDIGTALYFSVITITTTGFGDIAPIAGMARLVTCWEVVTGLLYQVFIFSLAAALVTPLHNGPGAQSPD